MVSIRSFARSGLRRFIAKWPEATITFLFALSRDQVFDQKSLEREGGALQFLFALSRDQVFDSPM